MTPPLCAVASVTSKAFIITHHQKPDLVTLIFRLLQKPCFLSLQETRLVEKAVEDLRLQLGLWLPFTADHFISQPHIVLSCQIGR